MSRHGGLPWAVLFSWAISAVALQRNSGDHVEVSLEQSLKNLEVLSFDLTHKLIEHQQSNAAIAASMAISYSDTQGTRDDAVAKAAAANMIITFLATSVTNCKISPAVDQLAKDLDKFFDDTKAKQNNEITTDPDGKITCMSGFNTAKDHMITKFHELLAHANKDLQNTANIIDMIPNKPKFKDTMTGAKLQGGTEFPKNEVFYGCKRRKLDSYLNLKMKSCLTRADTAKIQTAIDKVKNSIQGGWTVGDPDTPAFAHLKFFQNVRMEIDQCMEHKHGWPYCSGQYSCPGAEDWCEWQQDNTQGVMQEKETKQRAETRKKQQILGYIK